MTTKINKPNCSTLRNLALIVTPNNFGKHVNCTSQGKKVNIQENKMLLEKDKMLSKQKVVASVFNKHFRLITDSLDRILEPRPPLKKIGFPGQIGSKLEL